MALTNNELELVMRLRDEFSSTFKKVMNDMSGGMKKVSSDAEKASKQTHEFFSGSIVAIAAKLSILEHALRRAFSIGTYLVSGYKEVEDFNMFLIKTAAEVSSRMAPQKGVGMAQQFQEAYQYAEGVYNMLLKINPQVVGGQKELEAITEEMHQQGQIMLYQSPQYVKDFTTFSNAVISMAMAYPNKINQIHSEVRALLQGELRVSDQMARKLDAIMGGNLKNMMTLWKSQGPEVVMRNISEYLKGYDVASEKISLTWSAISSTMETTWQLIQRTAWKDFYKEVNTILLRFSSWIAENKDSFALIFKKVGLALRGMLDLFLEFGKEINKTDGINSLNDSFKNIIDSLGQISYVWLPALGKGLGATFSYWIGSFKQLIYLQMALFKASTFSFTKAEEYFNKVLDMDEGLRKSGKTMIDFVTASPEDKENQFTKFMDERINKWKNLKIEQDKVTDTGGKYPKLTKQTGPDEATLKKEQETIDRMNKQTLKAQDEFWGAFVADYDTNLKTIVSKNGLIKFNEWALAQSIKINNKIDASKIALRIKAMEMYKEDNADAIESFKKRAQALAFYGTNEKTFRETLSNEAKDIYSDEINYYLKLADLKYAYSIAQEKDATEAEKVRLAERQGILDKYSKRESELMISAYNEQRKVYTTMVEENTKKLGDFYELEQTRQKENSDVYNKDIEERTSRYDEYLSLLINKDNIYVSNYMALKKQNLELERDAIIDNLKQKKVIDMDEINFIQTVYAQKIKESNLTIRESGLKTSQDFSEGWKVALEQAKNNAYTFAQAGKEYFQAFGQGLETMMGDFFYDSWTNKLKSAEEYFLSFTNSIGRMFSNMLSKMIQEWVMSSITGEKTGAYGQAFSAIIKGASSWFGGMSSTPTTIGATDALENPFLHHKGGLVMHNGGEVPAILQTGEYVIRKNAVNNRTLPALENINSGGSMESGGSVIINISAMDASSFQQFLMKNENVLDPIMSAIYNKNGNFRKTMRGM
jgi:hypothetical protein